MAAGAKDALQRWLLVLSTPFRRWAALRLVSRWPTGRRSKTKGPFFFPTLSKRVAFSSSCLVLKRKGTTALAGHIPKVRLRQGVVDF